MFEKASHRRTMTLFVPAPPDSRILVKPVAQRTDPSTGNIEELLRHSSPNRWSRGWRVPEPPVARWWKHAPTSPTLDRPYDPKHMEYPMYDEFD